MNFLAHVYLSGDNKLLTVGNFIGDFVKGKQYEAFPNIVREGILLHREIDTFTDAHVLTDEARDLMRPIFGKYAGIYLDIFYDHFLAINWSSYHHMSLRWYSYRFCWWLVQNYGLLPAHVKGFLPNLIASNRLYSYHTINGIQRALAIMSAHTSMPDQSAQAAAFLTNNHAVLNANFQAFFPQLQHYVQGKLAQIL